MSQRPQDTSAAEPDGGNPHVRFRGGSRRDDRPGLLNRDGIADGCGDSFIAHNLSNARAPLLIVICLLMGSLSIISFVIHVKVGLRLLDFDDEMTELVIAKMIVQGKHLYRDVFDTHGVLPSMITHLYASAVSPSDFSYVRLSQAILAAISCIAVSFSAALKGWLTRMWAGALYLLLLSLVWNTVGYNVIWYDTVGGFLFVVTFSQLIMPLLLSEEPGVHGVFASGLATGLVFFCAISNAAAALLFIASSAILLSSLPNPKKAFWFIKAFLLGLMLSVLIVVAWLLAFGDLIGYFIYHIYFNLVVYRPFSPVDFFNNFSLSFGPAAIVHVLALALVPPCSLAIFLLDKGSVTANRSRRKMSALAVLAVGMVATNMLGRPGCADASLVNCSFAMLAMSIALLLQRALSAHSGRAALKVVAVTLGTIALIARIGASTDFWFGAKKSDMSKYSISMRPGDEPIYGFIQTITKSDGDILALPWHAAVYVKTDRTPASGNINYWSKQAEYYRNPVYGYKIDVCADMSARRPSVIWFFNWRMSADGSIDEYEPCVLTFITKGYSPLSFDSPWYIRDDLFKGAVNKLPRDADTRTAYEGFQSIMRRTALLTPSAPIEIRMSPTHLDRQVPLRRLGIMLTNYGREKVGDAELHLMGPNGAELIQLISLSDVTDNRYHYFKIDGKRYTTGEIRSVKGGDISAWESDMDVPYTCAIFEYADNSRRYTPACPIM